MLSLHHLTSLDATPGALVEIAARLGADAVSLFVEMPVAARRHYPMVDPAGAAGLGRRLSDAGLGIGTLEVFALDSDADPRRFEPALAAGRLLGGRRATVHVHGCDAAAAAARLAAFAAVAGQHGIVAALEFNAFSAVTGLAAAEQVVRAAGVGEIVLDCLHFARSGGTAAGLDAAAGLVRHMQLCDGPAEAPGAASGRERWQEAIADRMLPGDGAFPLADWLRRMPQGCSIDVEVPQGPARKAGVPPMERARRAIAAARHLLCAPGVGSVRP